MEQSRKQKNNKEDVYGRWQPWAKKIKIRCQMITGALTVMAIIAAVGIRFTELAKGTGSVGGITSEVFAVTAAGLAVAAALELAYALYTPGPDEALDPLILGVSSTFLFLASQSTKLDWQFGVAAVLLAVALYGLFKVKERFREVLTDTEGAGEAIQSNDAQAEVEIRSEADNQSQTS